MIKSSELRAPTSLQEYISSRVKGAKGPQWLDGQRLDQVATASAVLGTVMLHGFKTSLFDRLDADLEEAGEAGFSVTSGGAATVREFLLARVREVHEIERYPTPRSVFGRLYTWAAGKRDIGPIRDVLRDVVVDNFVIEPGAEVLGKHIEQRRLHNLVTLSASTSIPHAELREILEQHEVLPRFQSTRTKKMPFDAVKGAAAARCISDDVRITEAIHHLRCDSVTVNSLLLGGHIETGSFRRHRTVPGFVTMTSMEKFLRALEGCALQLNGGASSSEFCSILDVDRCYGWPIDQLMTMIFCGAIPVYAARVLPGLKDCALKRSDMDELLVAESGPSISLAAAAAFLRSCEKTIHALAVRCDANGEPFLKMASSSRGMQFKSPRNGLCRDSFEFFAARHATLNLLSAERGLSLRAMERELTFKGVKPILPSSDLCDGVYPRDA